MSGVRDIFTDAPPHGARKLAADLADAFGGRQALFSAGEDQLAGALRGGNVGAFEATSPYAACLLTLLSAAGWRGAARDLGEALPHFTSDLDLTDILNILAQLGIETRTAAVHHGRLDPRLLPALLVRDDGAPLVVLDRAGDGAWRVFDGDSRQEAEYAPALLNGIVHALMPASASDEEPVAQQQNWIGSLLWRFRRLFALMFLATAMLNAIGLAVPLYVMTLYDKVIPTQNLGTLAYLAAGVLALIGVEAVLRGVRARMVAYVGARIDYAVTTGAFGQILGLPPALTESVPIGAQASRLREFDSLREIFTGPLATLVFDAPFLIGFIGVVWWLGGPLAWVPVGLVVAYLLVGMALAPVLKKAVQTSSRIRARRHGFLLDLLGNMRAIKQMSAEALWLERFRVLSAEGAWSQFRLNQLSTLLQTLGHLIMLAAGIITMALGVVQVVDQRMSVGALVAVMAIIWRILSPLQSLFLTLSRIEQIKIAVRQVNQLMRMPTEPKPQRRNRRVQRNLYGGVEFQRVSFRYRGAADPSLLGVSLKVEPGELVAVIGGNGAGKSTLLNMLIGMDRCQAGQILLDGVDMRQLNPVELRQMIGYVPQAVRLFHGTIAQNLRLADPTASDEDLQHACAEVGILERIQSLPRGFDTRLGDHTVAQFNSGFLQALSIARALVKGSRLLLLDEPAQGLDEEGDRAFMTLLGRLKGRVTVLMVSHRPSHIRMADRAVLMARGQVVATGRPDDVLMQSMKEQAA